MNTATLFTFGIDDWRSFMFAALAAGSGYAIVYVLGLDSDRIPLVQADHKYKVPVWFLGITAGGLSLSFAFCLAAYLTLTFATDRPSVAEFKRTFFRPTSSSLEEWLAEVSRTKEISKAYVMINTYDGNSNFSIFANNRRVFATYIDCVFIFQCINKESTITPPDGLTWQRTYRSNARTSLLETHIDCPTSRELNERRQDKIGPHYCTDAILGEYLRSNRQFGIHVDCILAFGCPRYGPSASQRFRVDSRYRDALLSPYILGEQRIINSLKNGHNIIDIISGNSGLNSCEIDVEIVIISRSGDRLSKRIKIYDDEPSNVKIYNVDIENGSYRICDRLRLEFEIGDHNEGSRR